MLPKYLQEILGKQNKKNNRSKIQGNNSAIHKTTKTWQLILMQFFSCKFGNNVKRNILNDIESLGDVISDLEQENWS